MEPPVKLNCNTCTNEFDRAAREHRRQLKRGKNEFYCSISCAMKKENERNPRQEWIKNFKVKRTDKIDPVAPFRWFIKTCKARVKADLKLRQKYVEMDIDKEYLQELWQKQNGICPFTGSNLLLPKNTYGYKEKCFNNASLDRIDNAQGYIKGNVRFISLMANYARNTFHDEQLIEFCTAVANNYFSKK
jgi:hypothetical protein